MTREYKHGELGKLIAERLQVREHDQVDFNKLPEYKKYHLRLTWANEFLEEFKLIGVKKDIKPEVELEAKAEPAGENDTSDEERSLPGNGE